MENSILPVLLKVGGVLMGGGLGYLYYKFVGCKSGVCPLTSTPHGAIIMGVLIASAYVFRS